MKILNQLSNFASDKAPAILTGVVIFTSFSAIVAAVEETPKAMKLIEAKKKQMHVEKLPKIEIVKTTWKNYAPSAILFSASVIALVGLNKEYGRRSAVLATALAASETALKDFTEKTMVKIGEKKTQEIRDAVIKDKIEANPVSDREVILTGKGKTLFFDPKSGRYFENDIEEIKRAVNELNRDLLSEMYMSLNDFYYAIGLKGTELGSEMGWNVNEEGLIDIGFSAQIAEDGRPCLALIYNVSPRYDYGKNL